MKRVLFAMLAAVLMMGSAGCNRADQRAVQMVNSQVEINLSRPEIETVYGVEAPDSSESLLLDEKNESTEEKAQEVSSQEETIYTATDASQPSADATQAQQTASQKEQTATPPAASSVPQKEQANTASVPQKEPETVVNVPKEEQTSSASKPEKQTTIDRTPVDQTPNEPAASQAAVPQQPEQTPQAGSVSTHKPSGEMRGIWLSYLTLDPMIRNKSEAQFTSNLNTAFKNAAAEGFNTVFVQVRPFGDALYDSQYYPWSYLLSGNEGKAPGYDPLAIMCRLADAHNLRIEAWINPYRVRTSGSKQALSADNPAKKWLRENNDAALEWNGGIYYNPGSQKARQLIINGVKEIVKNYDVDGIHFDDYFYPTTDMSFDKATYQASGSKLSQADWRRENVNILVREVYTAIKTIDPGCVFGISPQGNTSNNYDGQFIDCAKWLANPGYVDYICPQIYFGYENSAYPFNRTVEKWDKMIKVSGIDLYVGIAAYKLGTEDSWAGNGKNEWKNTKDILAQMVKTSRTANHYGGVALYSYESLFLNNTAQVAAERENLREVFRADT